MAHVGFGCDGCGQQDAKWKHGIGDWDCSDHGTECFECLNLESEVKGTVELRRCGQGVLVIVSWMVFTFLSPVYARMLVFDKTCSQAQTN